jgi:ribosomal protein S18 acetylase RimI-like enzyme
MPQQPPIRPATDADIPFLWDMLFEAAFIPDDERAAWRRAPEPPPELVRYLDGWGRRGDAGVVAQGVDGVPLGAAWYRLFAASDRGNGILAHRDIPELSIAVVPEHRGRHIGRELLTALAQTAKDEGYRHLMLSVDPDNVRAVRLYERAGFGLVDSADPARGTSLIMRLDL